MASYLDKLENDSIYIIREAYSRFRDIALLWSVGKDSTALLWIARKAFFGKIPFPVMHLDTGFKFPEMYRLRDQIARKWGLDLLVAKNDHALKRGMSPASSKFACCHALKTEALKIALRRHGFKALLLAIRRDEHGVRAKERYFSPRGIDFLWRYKDQPAELWDFYKSGLARKEHARVHPMLHWSELDIWEYARREKLPVVSLYFSKKGARYRSIGCRTCCAPVVSRADTIAKIIRELRTTKVAERSGRAQDKENAHTMQKLRSLGYM